MLLVLSCECIVLDLMTVCASVLKTSIVAIYGTMDYLHVDGKQYAFEIRLWMILIG